MGCAPSWLLNMNRRIAHHYTYKHKYSTITVSWPHILAWQGSDGMTFRHSIVGGHNTPLPQLLQCVGVACTAYACVALYCTAFLLQVRRKHHVEESGV